MNLFLLTFVEFRLRYYTNGFKIGIENIVSEYFHSYTWGFDIFHKYNILNACPEFLRFLRFFLIIMFTFFN